MTTAAAGVRVQRSRWLLLFVALALVALLLAAQRASPPRQALDASTMHHARPPIDHTTPTPSRISPPSSSSASRQVPALRSVGTPSDASPTLGAITLDSSTSPSTTPPSLSSTPTTTINLSPVAAARTLTESGWLSSPSSVAATYRIGSRTDATATFTGAPELTLAATCASGDRSMSGVSPLSLSNLDVGCSLTLSGAGSLPITSYSIRLTPR